MSVPFSTVNGWDAELLDPFEAGDLAALDEAANLGHGWADRLERLEVPESGKPWLDEVVDGIRINALRAEHTAALYRAIVADRRAEIAGGQPPHADAQAQFALAEVALKASEDVIRRREAAYRYPAEQVYGGGLSPDTAVPNGTTYGYRVHTKTHLLTYWQNRHDEVAVILGGGSVNGAMAVRFEDSMTSVAAPLSLSWPDILDLGGTVSVGGLEVGPADAELSLGSEPGYWVVAGELTTSGAPVHVAGAVVRSAILGETSVGGLQLEQPEAPLAQTALAFVMPPLRWAWIPDGPALALGYDPDENGSILHEHVQRAAVATGDQAGFITEPFLLSIPVQRSGGTVLHIRVQQAVIAGAVDTDAFTDVLGLNGEIRVDDLVTVLIEIGGFDQAGALSTLSEILDFDAADPPVTVPLVGQFDVQRLVP